jgi:hypothetical protein
MGNEVSQILLRNIYGPGKCTKYIFEYTLKDGRG